MKNFITILVLLLSTTLSFAQKDVVTGYWEGVLTQNHGGFSPEYKFELYLYQKGDEIVGRAVVSVDDIFVDMDIVGEIHSGLLLQIKDVKIVNDKRKDGMEWCMKEYQAILKRNGNDLELNGHWQGKTSFSDCIPGKISLKKSTPRA